MVKTDPLLQCKFSNCRSFSSTIIQMALQDSLAESRSHCSIIIIPVILALNASTPHFHWEAVWKQAGIPQGVSDLSKLRGTQTPSEVGPFYSMHKFNKTASPPLLLLPSTWLKSHHPQTKWKKRGRERGWGEGTEAIFGSLSLLCGM